MGAVIFMFTRMAQNVQLLLSPEPLQKVNVIRFNWRRCIPSFMVFASFMSIFMDTNSLCTEIHSVLTTNP